MLVDEIFVFEPVSVDRLSPSAVMVGEVASLGHEARNHPVEYRALEVEGLA